MEGSGAKRVFWIEDHPQEIRWSKYALASESHEVVIESDFEAARRGLGGSRFDLLLVDFALQDRRGRFRAGSEIVEELRKGSLGSVNAAVQFAFVTAYPGWVPPHLQSIAGCLGVFSKAENLQEEIREVLSRLVSVPGIVDVEGNPLRSDSPERLALEVGFRKTTEKVRAYFAEHPESLRQLKPRQFEELIAELFERDGFAVELTPFSGDRGVDIYAARQTELGELKYVVECKRYSEGNPVKPALVRELRGVVDRTNANCGVLVTTSSFSVGAVEEQQVISSKISLKGLPDVAGWLSGRPILWPPADRAS